MTEGYTPFPQEELPADLPTIIVYGEDKSLYIPKREEEPIPRELPPEKEIFKPPAEEVLPPKITYIPVPSVYEVPPEEEEKAKFPWFWLIIPAIILLFKED